MRCRCSVVAEPAILCCTHRAPNCTILFGCGIISEDWVGVAISLPVNTNVPVAGADSVRETNGADLVLLLSIPVVVRLTAACEVGPAQCINQPLMSTRSPKWPTGDIAFQGPGWWLTGGRGGCFSQRPWLVVHLLRRPARCLHHVMQLCQLQHLLAPKGTQRQGPQGQTPRNHTY